MMAELIEALRQALLRAERRKRRGEAKTLPRPTAVTVLTKLLLDVIWWCTRMVVLVQKIKVVLKLCLWKQRCSTVEQLSF